MDRLEAMARDPRYAAYEKSDSRFQRAARLLQSVWRDARGYPMGQRIGRDGKLIPTGSRLPDDFARGTLANYLTDDIRAVVRETMAARTDQLIEEDRLLTNLLSSQPLCFNLFSPLKRDTALATSVLRETTGNANLRVNRVEFEYSPYRGAQGPTGDRSAFDVCFFCQTASASELLIAVEVKYHENMRCTPRRDHRRHVEVSRQMKCFDESRFGDLCKSPLEQVWRDHVLAAATAMPGGAEYLSVVLFPLANADCSSAVERYRSCLTDQGTFAAWHLETFHAALARHCTAQWVDEFHDRYLDFSKVGFNSPAAPATSPAAS